jgi:segregation and condensation protein A
MDYKVKIDVFEGPFDLLLHLVRINEMDIYDIPIAEITRQYLEYIDEMERLDINVAGEFLVMAATLINIKSRSIAPPPVENAEGEQEEAVDEEYESIRDAQDLMRRLIEYRQFKEMAVNLADREERQLRVFYRNSVLPRVTNDQAPEELREDINLLFSAFARVLKYAEGRPTHHVREEEFSVEEKIEILREQIALRKKLRVGEIFERCINKVEIITVFLALLELCRMKETRVRQDRETKEIYLMDSRSMEVDEQDEF